MNEVRIPRAITKSVFLTKTSKAVDRVKCCLIFHNQWQVPIYFILCPNVCHDYLLIILTVNLLVSEKCKKERKKKHFRNLFYLFSLILWRQWHPSLVRCDSKKNIFQNLLKSSKIKRDREVEIYPYMDRER